MYIRCYRSTADWSTKERVWRLIYGRGWMSDRLDTMWFYIPEDLLSFALLIDHTLVRIPKHDYIA
jgi:hypothetical protein